jgi:hypothetical protein
VEGGRAEGGNGVLKGRFYKWSQARRKFAASAFLRNKEVRFGNSPSSGHLRIITFRTGA